MAALVALWADGPNQLIQTSGSALGTLTATGSVVLPINALVSAATWQINGTFSGTVVFEATVDGTNYVATAVVPVGASRTLTTTATAPGTWQMNTAGFTAVRVRCSSYASGSIVIVGKRNAGPPPAQ